MLEVPRNLFLLVILQGSKSLLREITMKMRSEPLRQFDPLSVNMNENRNLLIEIAEQIIEEGERLPPSEELEEV